MLSFYALLAIVVFTIVAEIIFAIRRRRRIDRLTRAMRLLVNDLDEYRAKYWDLIKHVATVHPDETRHETAKRYIIQQERGSNLTEAREQAKSGL